MRDFFSQALQLTIRYNVYMIQIHNSLLPYCVLECLEQANKVLFMVVANHQLAAAFRHRNTSALQGYLEPTEVVPYP